MRSILHSPADVAAAQTTINRDLARLLPTLDFDAVPDHEVRWIDTEGRVFFINYCGWAEGNLMFGLHPPLGIAGLQAGLSLWGDWEEDAGFALDAATIYTQLGPVDLPQDAGLLLAESFLQTLVDGQHCGLVYRLALVDAAAH